jgi:hypothetical protein
VLAVTVGRPLPDVLWDGIVDDAKKVEGALPEALRVCIRANGDADFANFHADHANFPVEFEVTRDLAPHDCMHPALPAVVLGEGS